MRNDYTNREKQEKIISYQVIKQNWKVISIGKRDETNEEKLLLIRR